MLIIPSAQSGLNATSISRAQCKGRFMNDHKSQCNIIQDWLNNTAPEQRVLLFKKNERQGLRWTDPESILISTELPAVWLAESEKIISKYQLQFGTLNSCLETFNKKCDFYSNLKNKSSFSKFFLQPYQEPDSANSETFPYVSFTFKTDFTLELNESELLVLQREFEVNQTDNCFSPINSDTLTDFCHTVGRLKEHIKSGDFYVINAAVQIKNALPNQLFCAKSFLQSWIKKPSRFGVFFNSSNIGLMSFSPELFVSKRKTSLLTQPIKGTRVVSDFKNITDAAQNLWNDKKELYEQQMIVDLLRHDLLGVCNPGSVQIHDPFFIAIESTLLQMQTTLTGILKQQLDITDILNTMCPAGSITGAPKQSACRFISKFESESRGAYTGISGIIESNGDFDSQVLIRSFFKHNNNITAGVGAGITLLSNSESEAAELNSKWKSFRQGIW